jgi:hypothetical protein
MIVEEAAGNRPQATARTKSKTFNTEVTEAAEEMREVTGNK